jgi:Tol biopolymer transport system component
MRKYIKILMIMVLIASCQPNPVTEPVRTSSPIPGPQSSSIYDYFDDSITVKSVKIFTPVPFDYPKNITINIGEIKELKATVEYSDRIDDRAVSWISSDNSIATVTKEGLVKGLKEGKVIIKAISKYQAKESEPINFEIIKPEIPVNLNPTTSPSNIKNGKIAFAYQETDLETYSAISTINADGSELKTLSPNHGTYPQWSPDGSKILFKFNWYGPSQVIKDNNSEISIVNKDGSELTRLTGNTGFDESAQWSPDSSKIVFSSNRDRSIERSTDTKDFEIYTMNSDGSNQKRLTQNSYYDYDAKWSPDGKQIAFVSERDGQPAVYVINEDGSNEKKFIDNFIYITDIQWSPDSSKILFMARKGKEFGAIYLMNRDSTNFAVLSDNNDTEPRWSPDGSKILFASRRETKDFSSLYLMNPDGSNQRKISSHYDFNPQWSPDGSMIVFASRRIEDNINERIYIMNADGSDEHPLNPDFDIEDAFMERFPVWTK